MTTEISPSSRLADPVTVSKFEIYVSKLKQSVIYIQMKSPIHFQPVHNLKIVNTFPICVREKM